MLDLNKIMILAKGEIITPEVVSLEYNESKLQYEVLFVTGKKYSYNAQNIQYLDSPKELDPTLYKVSFNNKELYGISEIIEFSYLHKKYWHINFEKGGFRDYRKSELKIRKSGLDNPTTKNIHNYMSKVASFVSLKTEDGDNLLSKQYEKITFIDEKEAISSYFNPKTFSVNELEYDTPIFPFGCNASQLKAVKNALNNRLSVIQGPPGTGKTQTILNIIANLLIQEKTIQVVSNNNSATANVLEKLSHSDYGLGFLVAALGNAENKKQFLFEQSGIYPCAMHKWDENLASDETYLKQLRFRYSCLNDYYAIQEELAVSRQQLKDLEVEIKYFENYLKEKSYDISKIRFRKEFDSDQYLKIWKVCQDVVDKKNRFSLFLKLRCYFVYQIGTWSDYKEHINELLSSLQIKFYRARYEKLKNKIRYLDIQQSEYHEREKLNKLSQMSLEYLKSIIKVRYKENESRPIFTKDDLWKNPANIQKEYPIVLSTTFSARSSLYKTAHFDYVIIDEASQVDVVTGSIALSCAKNAVIVGDENQLPNVISNEQKEKLKNIFSQYNIPSGYDCSEYSFLQSITRMIPNIPQVLLREHYRCHPKIIDFCNRKFYGGNLVIMTEDNGEEDAISVIKTVCGNHARGRMNQRQIDVILQEVLPSIPDDENDVGIIAPYRNQVQELQNQLAGYGLDIATVHKFQGREKDTIIITTVDNELTSFSDDPNLLNVAISRAKKRLVIVVSGNEQPKNSNIRDLIEYINYHNIVLESSVFSIFDYLYKNYDKVRRQHLKDSKKVSRYDSENLMYELIQKILKDNRFSSLDVVCHLPLRVILRDLSLLESEEQRYASNWNTHIDFMIYNKISKKPILAIEVDGYRFHKKGTVQADRDKKKNHILEQYDIPLVRFSTNGSNEEKILCQKLLDLVS